MTTHIELDFWGPGFESGATEFITLEVICSRGAVEEIRLPTKRFRTTRDGLIGYAMTIADAQFWRTAMERCGLFEGASVSDLPDLASLVRDAEAPDYSGQLAEATG